jgi:hypothetical protein
VFGLGTSEVFDVERFLYAIINFLAYFSSIG